MRSLAQKTAIKFSFFLALMELALAAHFVYIVDLNARRTKDNEIHTALVSILDALKGENSLYAAESKLPYYITYSIYDGETKEILATNGPLIPILPEAEEKPRIYQKKSFYTDGDLNVVYQTHKIKKGNTTYVIQVSNSIDRDKMANIFNFMTPKSLALGFIPLLIISYFTSFFIAKRTLRPIVKMTKAAASISTSNLDALLSVSSKHDELDSLAHTFNDLFRRLKQDFIALNSANQAKSSFLSNMSHEIRTPINAILGLDEMITRESTEPQIQSYARDIQSSGKSLLSIINDILDFSKIEAGKMEIIPVDYDLCTTIIDLVNMVSGRAEKKGLDFIINIDKTMPHKLNGDETRIKQCILNILTNAIKYTPKGSVTMNIGFERAGENKINLWAQVIDTGIGIKQEDIKKLFDPFERIEERRNRTIEGTGLGMNIVKNLLQEMGSRLDVKSEYGKGSDFSFKVTQEVLDWDEIGTYEEIKEKVEEEAAAYKESFQAPDARILVVDDTPLNLTVIKGLLRSTRIQVETAESGFDALKMARGKQYDIILIDHRMPKMDGIEMLHVLRGEETSINQKTTCIALTANAISGAREMYLESGFEDYLSKPVEASKLEEMLVRYLPPSKILHSGQEGYIEKENSWNGLERRKNVTVSKEIHFTLTLWQKLFGLDIYSAIHNCSSGEIFMEACKNFYNSIEEKSELIEQYKNAENWNDYTVLVHALKSSARLIGAMELSEQAAFLEQCGDEAKIGDQEALALINEKTEPLLTLYKSYSQKLASLLGIPTAPQEDSRPQIEQAKLNDALSALKEVVSVFDFDSADAIMAELEKYSMPKDFEEKYKAIKKAVQSVDQNEIMTLLA